MADINCKKLFERNPNEDAKLADLQELCVDIAKLKRRADALAGASIFGGPGKAGGTGPAGPAGPAGPVLPVVGGSGTMYATIAAALVGEAASQQVLAFATGAGTTVGLVVATGPVSPVDDFYLDWWCVESGVSPAGGMVNQFARVSDYVGATATLTIDKPLDYGVGAGKSVTLFQPIRIALLKDVVEDVDLTPYRAVELNLSGHRIEGRLDLGNVAGLSFVWIRGGGWITNGVEKANSAAALKVDSTSISRRDVTTYAILCGTGTHRVELNDCNFYGRVAGRSGACGWVIRNCVNYGANDGANVVPYALVETQVAQVLAVTQVDVEIQSQFSGAIFYSEGTITGPAAYVSVQATILPSANAATSPPQTASQRFAYCRTQAGGVITLTVTTGTLSISGTVPGKDNLTGAAISNFGLVVSMIAAQDCTAAVTLTLSVGFAHIQGISQGTFAAVVIEGPATMTGSVTLDGTTFFLIDAENGTVRGILILSPMTGTATLSRSMLVRGASGDGAGYTAIYIGVSQVAGAPSATVSGTIICSACEIVSPFVVVGTVSVGTWTVSSANFQIRGCSVFTISLGASVSGGTWLLSSPFTAKFTADLSSYNIQHNGTGGTLTVSGAHTLQGGRFATFRAANATGAGATVISSGAKVFVGCDINQTDGILARATTATSTARCQSSVVFAGCTFELATTLLAATLAGGVAEGPASVAFENCDFRSTLNDRSGAGTITFAAATATFRNTHVEGLFTAVGTSYTSLTAVETAFHGNAANKAITLTGVRPATLQYWKCEFASRFDDLLPEVINVYDVLPAGGNPPQQGEPLTITATPDAAQCVAASIVDGVSLDATIAGQRCIMVREGRVFAAVNAAVVSGDNLALDLVTPTQFTVSAFVPGQNGGKALEAAGATIAGKAYASVLVR